MAKKTWTVELDGVPHTVYLEHGYFSGKRLITVDGQPVKEMKHNLLDLGGDYPLTIGSHSGFVRISTNGLTFSYDLIVDGTSVTTGKAVEAKQPMPKWAWLFVGASAIVPILTLGGALPWLIGIGGAIACRSIASNAKRSRAVQVAACAGITLAVWAAVLALVFGTALLRSRPSEFSSAPGRFSVMSPVTLKESRESVDTAAGKADIRIFSGSQGDKEYGVIYVDYPTGSLARSDPQRVLDGGRDGSVSNIGGRIISSAPITVSGNPGQEFVAEGKLSDGKDVTYKSRIFLVGDRLYQVTAVVPKDQAGADVDSFLQSFKLTGQ